MKLSETAIEVLRTRYLLRNNQGKAIESPDEMFKRVARAVGLAEIEYGNIKKFEEVESAFYFEMSSLRFLPNSPTLMNAGTSLGQLSACFVIKIEDSMDSIFTALYHMAKIQQTGGGTGFNFSKLRPEGDIVKSTKGKASGPISFMRIFDSATNEIKQGGKRRGANMGILNFNHPDIIEFLRVKLKEGELSNFNLSVGITNGFMDSLKKDNVIPLINPRTQKVVRKIKVRELFNLIVDSAWRCGDPGLIFLDTINQKNPTPEIGRIEATNPCGEVPLLPYESCNLGSINLSLFVKENKKIDFEGLRRCIRIAVRFLDNVIDVNKYPLPETEVVTKGNRKIGLGVMGFADMLLKLKVPYYSQQALKIAERIMKFINTEAYRESVKIAKEKGSFPNIEKSIYSGKSMRNATRTSIAPTGSISIIAGTTSGIEPVFAHVVKREGVLENRIFEEINPTFVEIIERQKLNVDKVLSEIREKGLVTKTKNLPHYLKKLLLTALEIPSEFHIKMQSVFQRWTDNAVSKTVNLPFHATREDVKKCFLLAHKLGCKGITVYRYGSRQTQVLKINTVKEFNPSYLFKCDFDCCCPSIPPLGNL